MTLPYLIVVADCKDELAGGNRIADALLEAVFGTIVTKVTTHSSGEHTFADSRLHDGYWGVPWEPKNRNVSGVLILPKPHLWDLRDERCQPLLLRNPSADHPLPNELLPLPGLHLNEENKFTITRGTKFADLLGLPAVWPPVETA
jgi:hypothetical protein